MRTRRSIRVALSALVVPAGMLLFSASALAAPETPETGKAEPVTATSATLHGVLNPGAVGEPGSYQFSYEQSGSECAPGGTLDPSSPAFAKGDENEAVSVTVTGLEPDREYAFCVVAYSLAAEPSDGAVVPFKTLALPPAVDGESASVTSSGAILEAQINSENQETGYSFEYSTSSTLAGAITVVGGMLSAYDGDQGASVSTSVLQPDTTYYYRVLAKNLSGEEKIGPIESFRTVAVPHTKPVSAVTATSATLNGELASLHASPAVEYFFDYHLGGECSGGASTTPASAGAGPVSTPVSGLQPGASYAVCLVTSDSFGSEVDPATPVVSFTTPPAAPKVDGEGPLSVTPFEGTLEAQINPDGKETSYSFEYSTTETLGKLTGAITTLNGASPLTGTGDQTANVSTGRVLTSDTTYHFRVIAKNTLGESEGAGEFTTATAEAPIVESESTPFLSATGVTLQAQIDPNYQATAYTFEYATEASLLGTAGATEVPGGSISAGIGGQSASVRVSEALTPGATYYYQVIARNATGTTTGLSTVEHFTTPIPPEAVTGGAEGVTFGAATVSGTVNSEGQETFYSIQYGTTTGYGQETTPMDAGAETTSVATGPIHLNTLTPSTTYHYRLVATNYSGETTVGADATFTTAPAPPTQSEGEPTPITPTPIGAAPVGSTFPNLTAIAPIPGPKEAPETTSTAKSLTKAQKLAKALKACKEKAKGAKRTRCEKQARARYGKTTKKKGR